MTTARATDLARQLRESRELEAAALRLAHSAGFTDAEVRAEVAHHRGQWARLESERDELEAIRARMVDLAQRLQRSTSPAVWTFHEVGAALESAITGKGFRFQLAQTKEARSA